jgi:hypothetical protein
MSKSVSEHWLCDECGTTVINLHKRTTRKPLLLSERVKLLEQELELTRTLAGSFSSALTAEEAENRKLLSENESLQAYSAHRYSEGYEAGSGEVLSDLQNYHAVVEQYVDAVHACMRLNAVAHSTGYTATLILQRSQAEQNLARATDEFKKEHREVRKKLGSGL